MATKIDPGALELHRSQSWTINSDIEETTKPKQQEKKSELLALRCSVFN